MLGIDIGTAAIRVVELSKGEDKHKLENYGEIQSKYLYGKPFRQLEQDALSLATDDIAEALSAILDETGIDTQQANFSLPDFSSFFTTFTLPPMTREELQEAVRFEARQHVPLPISEMALDWATIGGGINEEQREEVKILLVAIPQRVVSQYQEIAQKAQLNLNSLEAEVFSLSRALIGKESEETVALVDIGAQSTTCSIVEKGTLKMSHSFNESGDDLTKALLDTFDLNPESAERLKMRYGLTEEGGAVAEVLSPVADSIIMKIDQVLQHFHQDAEKTIDRLLFAGGTANMPGIVDYITAELRHEAERADAFSRLSYPPVLESVLRKSGPLYSVSLGVAAGGLQP